MRKIRVNSFEVDHTTLDAGLYLREVKWLNPFTRIKIWDLRMRAPYDNNPIDPAALHCIEHCCAVGLRAELGRKYVGFYIYGCMTGCAFVTKAHVSRKKVARALYDTFLHFKPLIVKSDVPCLTPKECGNHSFCNLEGANLVMNEYSKILGDIILH